MNVRSTPWMLPGLHRWILSLEARLSDGLAVLPTDAGRPAGADDVLRDRLRYPPCSIHPKGGASPASEIAEGYGTAPTLDALLKSALDEETAFVDLSQIPTEDHAAWSTFISRFAKQRADGRPGPDLLFVCPPCELEIPADAFVSDWREHLRRGDRIIWAEENLASTREGLAAELAVELAVELCVWRLDLAAALVQACLNDLAAPIEWLKRRAELPIAGTSPSCPLALLSSPDKSELHQRIWKAQLTTFFPELERQRQEFVATHRRKLWIDDHLRSLGVTEIEEIELGALRFQLKGSLSRPMADQLELLSKARNALAHHKPISPEDTYSLFHT